MGRSPAQDLRRLKRRLADETGVTLVETLISAAILVVILSAVFTTLDASGRTTAANRARTVAASLAEQDQERLRALSAPSLSNYHETRTENVDGNVYTIDSDTDWVYDATGSTESCLNSSNTQANYIRTTTTVTSQIVGKRIKPVQMRSLVAPRVGDFGANQGTLAVFVKDQLDKPVQNISVSVAGPVGMADVTNEFGCAVFSHIPVGEYKAKLDTAGWVDTNRNQYSEQGVTVSTGKTSAIQFTYAMAAGVEVKFETRVDATSKPAYGNAITVANSNMSARPPDPAGVGRFLSPAAPTSALMIPAYGLFPFPQGYTAYAGDCDANNPTLYNANYYDTFPGFANVAPGAIAQVTVREPALNIHVRRRTAASGVGSTYLDYGGLTPMPVVPAQVIARVKLTNAGCSAATSTFDLPVKADGTLLDPGLPFGTYSACVSAPDPLPPYTVRRTLVTGIVNTNPNGLGFSGTAPNRRPTTKISINSYATGGSTAGTCP